jgi:hypothetical protein
MLKHLMIVALLASPLAADVILVPRNDTNPNDNAQREAARRAAVQAAQGEVDRAQASVAAASTRIRATWKANPDLLAAEKDLTAKQEAFEAARAPVIAKLQQDPDYQQIRETAAKADQQVAEAHGIAPATRPSPAVIDAAKAKLEVKSALGNIEDKAIAADPAASKAKADLDAAREKMKVLQAQFQAVLLNDPEYKAALDQLNAARSRLTAASGQY